jgi:serine/threonine-protein kinase
VVVLEYLPGGTLAARLPGPLGVGPALDLAISLAEGLAAVHAAGLLHRDVKPSNVGFDADGTPRLLDFGLSRVSPGAASTAPDLLLGWAGTPIYMAPAVLSGGEPGPADDVWSLLVLLHECLAGVHPLRGVPRDDLLSVLRRGGFPDLRSSLPGPAAPLAEKMRGWLEAGGSRPGTALDLRAALVALRLA